MLVVSLVALAGASGCSMVMMERLDHPYGPVHVEEPRCTATKGWVLVDLAAAVGSAVGAGAMAVTALDDRAAGYRATLGVSAVASAVVAVAFGGSAWSGNRAAHRCRAARGIKDDNVRRAGGAP
ncbi:MAG: hypothetical protein IPL61_05250 [Myxococcales bacterium]|nr:hypothetical protein [Myxococcales bacterium]